MIKMKTGKIIFLFILLIAVPLISSLEINMNTEIPQGETVIATIEGNFLDPIEKENIEFYRNDVIKTAFEHDVGLIDGVYYISFKTVGKQQNNYSIYIKNVRYYVGTQVSTEGISKNFTITNETADFSIDKGFIVTQENFTITVQNLNPSKINISLDVDTLSGSSGGFLDLFCDDEKLSDSFEVLSGDTKEIEVSIENVDGTTVREITLSSENTKYEIPVYIIAENLPDNEVPDEEENDSFYEQKNESQGSFWDIFKKENKSEDAEDENEENSDDGYDIVTDDEGNEYAVDGEGNVIDSPASSKTCEELKGKVCSANQICENSNSTYAKNGICCLSSCTKKPAGKSGKIIGWTIIGIILILLIWFKIKYGRTRRRKFILPR